MSYLNGPGGVATPGELQVKVGWTSVIAAPAESLSVVSRAQAGTAIGPTRPVVAVAPVLARASTRQKSGDPGLSGRARAYWVASTSDVSTIGSAKPESRATRSR